ncbi:DnaJ C-terminal domain-containing protein [Paraburkholderia phymatum]|uniref:Heat shock protein DnaJ domain protein n=1 Tax=Paraburkholderia phymatum (strain DSM 17167 / CIP 108236 / LMG 21445 / STM815) TaxID=391038 RepID=B2JWJ5_PARP8|nr:DnaJ C-terminal domain-containing protein [Paraburkholderia phymatum]ACC75322.1 heat shock protein DnaJ domain protein [Paraburkholderia phymatum STM815]
MKYKDYYAILGLERTAAQEDIKRAYRKLARKYHPDVSKHSDAEDRFKELGEAYEVLKDPEKRAAYDRMGTHWRTGEDFQPPPNWDEGFEFSGAGEEGAAHASLNEFFEAMFGGARTAHARRRASRAMGEDHHAKVVIDLEDAYRGAQRSISLQLPVIDEHGHVSLQSRTLNVSIPKGVRAGQHLRLAGQGGTGAGGGSPGDLYLEIAFREHPRFRVDGADVSIELPVAPWEAALGTHVTVPTPDGWVEMTVPKGAAGGTRMRLKGKGIPGSPPGDMYAILNIVLPPADSELAKAAYDTMRQAFNFDPRARFYG